MKKIVILIITLLFIFIGYFFVINDHSITKDEINYLKNKKEIVFVSQSNYPPFEFLSDRMESAGMMIELARFMSTEFGFDVRFINTTFARAQQMILNGEADVLTSFFYSDERNKRYNFSKVVFEIPASIFVRNENREIKSLEDLNGRKVAIQKGDYAIDYINSQRIKINLVETDDFLAAANKLIKGEVEAVVGDEQIIFYYLSKFDLASEIKTVGKPLYIGQNCMATKKDNKILLSILNKGIALAEEKGIIDSINRKWLGDRGTILNNFKKYLYIFSFFIIVLTAIILSFWLWNLQLRKKVEENTKRLTEINKELTLHINKLNAILSASPDGIGVANTKGELLFISDRLATMYKIDPKKKQKYLNVNFIEFVNESYREKLKTNLDKMFKGQKDWVLSEYLVRNALGEPFWVEVSSALLYNETGEPDGILFVERDITERKKMEEDLRRYNEQLKENNKLLEELKSKAEEANKAKSRFLAIISHELRTPLNGILGLLELLKQEPEKLDEYLPLIHSSGEQLKMLISDISDIDKIEQGKLELVENCFDISKFINEVIYNAKIDIKDTPLELILDIDNLDGYYLGDATRLKQVVYNLINNAIKYTNEGYVKFTIKKLSSDDTGIRLYFEVLDTGIGIPENDLEKIFKPFKRIDSSYSRKRYGSGIGLFITKSILEMMNSKIFVESEVGKGSKFYFEVFIKKCKTMCKDSDNQTISTFNLKALVVDDNRVNLIVAENILKKLGIEVDIAENGIEAIEKVKEKDFDFIMMDIQMPEMDGLEASKQILQMGKKTKIFAMTANVYKEDIQKAYDAGMVDFCPKPFSLKYLESILKRHFGYDS